VRRALTARHAALTFSRCPEALPTILFDLHAGQDVFARFSAGRDEQLWYYDALASTFTDLTDSPMAAELRQSWTNWRS
jgi:hypothetical protein